MAPDVILVTGGAGFIGSHVVDELVDLGVRVRIIDHLHPAAHSGEPEYLNPKAEWLRADVREPADVQQALEGVTAVCHQASMVGLGIDFDDVADYVSHNDLGTAVLVRGLARRGFAGRIVLASSMVIYGEGRYRCSEHGLVAAPSRSPHDLDAGRFEPACARCARTLTPESVPEDASPDPRNVYAATKLHQEHLCAAFGRETGAIVTALRYHNVYGPRMPRDTPYAGVAAIFRSKLEAGEAPLLFEDGGQRRDFVHVRDVAHANVLALTGERPFHGALNVATGRPRTVGDMGAALAGAMSGPAPEVTGAWRGGDVRHVFASTDRAAEALGFRAEIGFEDGMTELARAQLRS